MVFMKGLSSLYSSMLKHKKDIERFLFTYNGVRFDAIYVLSNKPHELLLGALGESNWACVVKVHCGFKAEMTDEDFFALCKILNLAPGKGSLTSFDFLSYISRHSPRECSPELVNPQYMTRYVAKRVPKNEEPEKDVFLGWNDHLIDKRKAQNFNKTELYFGKRIANFCRTHNISSMWTTRETGKGKTASFPPGYISKL